MSFVHLHTHSEYSLLDGANKLEALIERAVGLGMPALALTDHGNLHGARRFYDAARASGLKPIIGCEAYVAFGDRRTKERPGDAPADYGHLILLARDREGYRNLVKLVSIGHVEGFYRRPRIDHETLEAHASGLICLSACMSSELALYLLQGQYERAKRAAEWHARVFGAGNYWLEVQDHGIPGEETVREGVYELADQLGLPVVATNDAHYLHKEDADAHDILLCIGTGKDRDDPKRLRFYGQESYFKSPQEMATLFSDRPDVIDNTLRVAERCELDFEEKVYLPAFPRPAEYDSEDDLLRELASNGARQRYGDPLPAEVNERLNYELDVITRLGYSGYFLIVWDFIRAARERGVPVGPGRGSAAGSLVAYALRITDIDPLRFGLLFERFLNPDRISMPDIDVDFCYERRGEVIDYVRAKYGADSVGQIVTFGTMQARAVVRDVGRTLGFTPAETDRVAKLIPSSPGYSLSLSDAVERVDELKTLYKEEQRYRELLDYAATLEGLSRHTSVHAAGVVIAPGPLADYVPVMTATTRGAGGESANGELVITQYDMVSLERSGMLKFDFLGLRTLTVISDAAAMIEQRHGVEIAWEAIGLDDPAVYEMLAQGETSGVFQFESTLATEKLRAMRCDRFDDLIAVNALIRPGPLDSGMTDVFIRRKRGAEPVSYPHESLAEVLEPTYGVITYQEQVMQAANRMAGFSLAEADVLRKAVGKKDPVLIRQELDRFTRRCIAGGVTRREAELVGSLLETFGRYGFPKAHSTAYAVLSYRTAWLKRHYPAEFMAALLTSEIGNTDNVVGYIGHCRYLGLEVLPPHVNESGYKFTVVSDASIRFGLGAIRGVGRSAIDSIIEARQSQGPFTSLFDFCTRVDLRLNNKRVIEALIGAGALDGLGRRAALAEGLETTLREAQLRQRERETGQRNLFGGLEEASGVASAAGVAEPPLPDIPEWSESEKLAREKELVGFYVSGHPLDAHRDLVELYGQRANTANLAEFRDKKVELVCVVTEIGRRISRKDGSEWGRLVLEDYHGTAVALAFREVWNKQRLVVEPGKPVLLRGSVSGRERDEGNPPLFLDEIVPLEDVYDSGRVAVCIQLGGVRALDAQRLEKAIEIARAHPGPVALQVVLENGGEEPARLRSRALSVAPAPAVLGELRGVLGEGQVRLVEVRG